ncbi:MAG: phytoene desaturase family protein [Desulforhopalus sp.]
MRVPLLVIGGGLSGIAAAIRAARFTPDVLLLEKHTRLGGLNSYFYRNKLLYETGLHAITNYAEPKDKRAPLNRLLRQLKIKRSQLSFCQQYQSEILFHNCETLTFSNDYQLLESQITSKFPKSADKWRELLLFLEEFNPFSIVPFRSAKRFLLDRLNDPLLVEMILCPLMYYGSSCEDDMDLNQFAIMFQAIYLEGMFRPQGSIKDFLDLLIAHLRSLGGHIRKNAGVKKIHNSRDCVTAVELESGEVIECDNVVSTIGHLETLNLLDTNQQPQDKSAHRLGFIENIFQLPDSSTPRLPTDKTIIFYNKGECFAYRQPETFADFASGVNCFPGNFQDFIKPPHREIRSTHLANYGLWRDIEKQREAYEKEKSRVSGQSLQCLEEVVGEFGSSVTYSNCFTPVTIKRYTSKIDGAIYGSPVKIKDGDIGFSNLYLAGTDQGFLGIIGSMLSGVSIVNQHILNRL